MGITYEIIVTKRERDNNFRVIRETRERQTRTLEAPTEWGMFSAAGNRSLTKKAETVIRKAEKAMERPYGERHKAINAALVSFLAGWERMGYSKSHGEASDTAVRECVGHFHDTVLRATIGLDHSAWERHRDLAYSRVRKERARKAA